MQAMIALAHLAPTDNLHVADLPYRMSSWALDEPDNIGLWFDTEGELVGWAVMQTPFWTIDYVCDHRADGDLHRRILVWADERARALLNTPYGRPMWFANVYADQVARIFDLEAAGFASQADVGENSWSKVLKQRPAGAPVAERVLPVGFSIRPLAGEGEIEDYVQLHRAVFDSKSMTTAWRSRTLHCPEYEADLDLVAVAPDGRVAAFCVCWFDSDGDWPPRGQIEPMGVHTDFRNLGLGRAILSEGLRRLYRSDAESVYVETDLDRNAAMELYEAVGFQPVRDILVYRKDYGEFGG